MDDHFIAFPCFIQQTLDRETTRLVDSQNRVITMDDYEAAKNTINSLKEQLHQVYQILQQQKSSRSGK